MEEGSSKRGETSSQVTVFLADEIPEDNETESDENSGGDADDEMDVNGKEPVLAMKRVADGEPVQKNPEPPTRWRLTILSTHLIRAPIR